MAMDLFLIFDEQIDWLILLCVCAAVSAHWFKVTRQWLTPPGGIINFAN